MNNEEILTETLDRFSIFPIKYHDIWLLYKKQESILWNAEEIKYTEDLKDWNNLNNNEKHFIEHILAFFAGADGIVLENLMSNFAKDVQIAEARAFYSVQGYIESVHAQTYGELINTLIPEPDKQLKLFKAIETIPCVKKKADWALRWMNRDTASFAERLIAFVVVEGIFFSGAFCAIFWLKNRGLMVQALGHSNEFIARDEGLHATFGVTLYHHLKNKVPEERVHEIFKNAVEIEQEFITESIPCNLIGMNSKLMIEYIKFVADIWLRELGYSKLYDAKNPFSFMDLNNIDGKPNFFEKRVSEYNKAYVMSKASDREYVPTEEF